MIDKASGLMKIDSSHNIYISKRALKHFVESEKKEMIQNHTRDDTLERLFFAIDNIVNTYMYYDKLQVKGLTRLIYTKQFVDSRKHNLRIEMDTFLGCYEICSIHFQKRKTSSV